MSSTAEALPAEDALVYQVAFERLDSRGGPDVFSIPARVFIAPDHESLIPRLRNYVEPYLVALGVHQPGTGGFEVTRTGAIVGKIDGAFLVGTRTYRYSIRRTDAGAFYVWDRAARMQTFGPVACAEECASWIRRAQATGGRHARLVAGEDPVADLLPLPDGSACRWFALCGSPATHMEPHPVLVAVAACDRCPTIGHR